MPEIFFAYSLRILPAVLLGGVLLAVFPRRESLGRVLIHILLFILIRDAMTPAGLWQLGGERLLWIRFVPDAGILVSLSLLCLGLVFGLNWLEPELKALLVYFKGPKIQAILYGLLAAFVLFLPVAAAYRLIPLAERGGAVPAMLLGPILMLGIFGNFYEELLFRGYFQGWCEKSLPPWKAALLSGLLFAFGHVFLATTVTNTGLPVLAFTLYEGLACAFLRMKYGLVTSTLTHGTLIFLLASGLV
ncbi:MAG: lysostaphin resistance A-like protein [Candidatus Sericytochromatia bacterium]